jgi:uncharacterized protein (TIGR03083 family)
MSQTPDGVTTSTQADADPWTVALRRSHQRLRAAVDPLGPDQVRGSSYCREWSIAQVVSHLGSQAEIFGRFLAAAVQGQDPPDRDAFPPIWDAWNARSPDAQVADGLKADEATLVMFESLGPEQRQQLHLHLFGMDVDTTGLARMRLGEHAVHTWDVAVALDPEAELAPDAVALLVDTIGQLAARTGKPDGTPRRVPMLTTEPERRFTLETGADITLTSAPSNQESSAGDIAVVLPAAALLRLVYGRLDPEHTPPIEASRVDLGDLRRLFPGF